MGVRQLKTGKWESFASRNGVRYHMGLFDTESEARAAEKKGQAGLEVEGRVIYTDEVDVDFGIPWNEEYFKMEKGVLTSRVTPAKAQDILQEPNGEAKLKQLAAIYQQQPSMAKKDPLTWGWTLATWRRVFEIWRDYSMIVLFGGNRSTKSWLMARLISWFAMNVPGAVCRCYHVSEKRSIEDQQNFVWDSLPENITKLRRARGRSNFSVAYTQKNGFSGGVCILPPQPGQEKGGSIYFNNYRQYYLDQQAFEGMKAHIHWLDEESPDRLVETMLARGSADFHGKVILTFTTLKSYTDLVSKVLAGATTDRQRYSKIINRKLPIEQTSGGFPNCKILYFWSQDNPFIDSNEIVKQYSNSPIDVKLARLFGIPTRQYGNKFPKFNDKINVVAHGDLPFVKDDKYPVTRYMGCDPGGSKPWVMLWVAVDDKGNHYVYREWPDRETYGEWALPFQNANGKPIGKAGPAQRSQTIGYNEYADMIREMEKGESIEMRSIDPRAGASPSMQKVTSSDIVTEMCEENIEFIPAPGLHIEHGEARINDLLAWDDTQPFIPLQNAPRLFVSDQCGNFIYSMKEHTGMGGTTEATKDFIDVLRYILEHDPEYVRSGGVLETTGGGAY